MEIANKNFGTTSNKGGISIALGLFDSVHIAHQTIIKTAKEKANKLGLSCAVLTFSLESDRNQVKPLNKQNAKMILSNNERLVKFEELGAEITYIPEFYNIKNLSPEDFFFEILIKKCKVKAITCGYDYRFGSGGLGTTKLLQKLCDSCNIDLTIIEQQKFKEEVISSSLIRELLKQGNISKANDLLGYNYKTCYEVVKGKQLGRQIGFNTANQMLDENLTIPCYGVYKTITEVNGKIYDSITSIGVKPTVEHEHIPLSETHIFDFNQDIYGQIITVEYLDFIRDEQKFNSIDELQAQIKKDIEKCK